VSSSLDGGDQPRCPGHGSVMKMHKKKPGCVMTMDSHFPVSINLQAQAAAFKAAINQKTV